jgi:hypothetical protein
MTSQVANIIFNDSASKFNRDLVEFLKRNIDIAIRKGRLSFSFKIAQPNELPGLRAKGITRLPAMTVGSKTFVGVPDIIEEIRKVVRTSKGTAPVKTEDEIVRDYQMSAIGRVTKDHEGKLVVHDNDDDVLKTEDLSAKVHQEAQRRGLNKDGEYMGNQHNRPTNTDRGAERDDDNYEAPMRPRQNDNTDRREIVTRMQTQPRADNLADNPGMGDAFDAMRRIGRTATGEDKQDDDMMATLLARMA